MKLGKWIFLVLLMATTVIGQAQQIDPLLFLPETVKQARGAEWESTYSRTLQELITGIPLSPSAIRFAAGFCAQASFSSDPALAASMVHGLLKKADYSLRAGHPAGQVKVRAKASWEAALKETGIVDLLSGESLSLEQLQTATSLLGDNEQTIPKDKVKVKVKIDDKIKDKKEK